MGGWVGGWLYRHSATISCLMLNACPLERSFWTNACWWFGGWLYRHSATISCLMLNACPLERSFWTNACWWYQIQIRTPPPPPPPRPPYPQNSCFLDTMIARKSCKWLVLLHNVERKKSLMVCLLFCDVTFIVYKNKNKIINFMFDGYLSLSISLSVTIYPECMLELCVCALCIVFSFF